MTTERVAANLQEAMALLHWELRDLFISALAYGMVGTEADVREHLRTGNHLSAAQSAVIGAALNDALMHIDSTFRV